MSDNSEPIHGEYQSSIGRNDLVAVSSSVSAFRCGGGLSDMILTNEAWPGLGVALGTRGSRTRRNPEEPCGPT